MVTEIITAFREYTVFLHYMDVYTTLMPLKLTHLAK